MTTQPMQPAQPVAVTDNPMRRLALRRAISALSLIAALGLFLLWIPESSRRFLLVNLIANRLLIVMLVGFTLMVLSLFWARGQTLDLGLFKRLNLRGDKPNVWLDRLMWVITQLGSLWMVVLIAVIAYAFRQRRFALWFVVGSLTLLLLVTIVKAFTDRARPYIALAGTRVIGMRTPGRSFPSGHTTQTFFMMTLIVAQFEPVWILSAALFSLAAIVGITRVYLGVHYPRDVIAGAMLGVMWGIVTVLVAPYI